MEMPTIVKDYLAKLILKATAGIGGAGGWLAGKVMLYGGQYLYDLIVEYGSALLKNLQRKKEQAEAIKELEKVDKNPTSTPEERAKAYEDAINSGR